MTTKNKNQYGITPTSVYGVAPQPNITDALTKTQQQIEEQKNTHLLRMHGHTEKAIYATRALSYVNKVAASSFTQSAGHANQLNDAVAGSECHEQVKIFNHYNMELLHQNLCAVQDTLGNVLHTQVQTSFKEGDVQEKKRGLFGR